MIPKALPLYTGRAFCINRILSTDWNAFYGVLGFTIILSIIHLNGTNDWIACRN